MKNSFFDGTAFQLIGWTILAGLLTTVTFGIGFPWGLCMLYRWKSKHTVVSSRRLKFVGTGAELFWIWIFYAIAPYLGVGLIFGAIIILCRPFIDTISFGEWFFLIFLAVLALIYYAFHVKVQIEKWIAKHVEFESYYEETVPKDASTLEQTPASFAPINSGYTAATAVSSAAQTEKEINGVFSLGFVFGGVALSVLGLGLFLFEYILPGIAVFGIGLVLLLISYFSQ